MQAANACYTMAMVCGMSKQLAQGAAPTSCPAAKCSFTDASSCMLESQYHLECPVCNINASMRPRAVSDSGRLATFRNPNSGCLRQRDGSVDPELQHAVHDEVSTSERLLMAATATFCGTPSAASAI